MLLNNVWKSVGIYTMYSIINFSSFNYHLLCVLSILGFYLQNALNSTSHVLSYDIIHDLKVLYIGNSVDFMVIIIILIELCFYCIQWILHSARSLFTITVKFVSTYKMRQILSNVHLSTIRTMFTSFGPQIYIWRFY